MIAAMWVHRDRPLEHPGRLQVSHFTVLHDVENGDVICQTDGDILHTELFDGKNGLDWHSKVTD